MKEGVFMKPNKKKTNLDRFKVHEIDLGELKETVDNVVNKSKESNRPNSISLRSKDNEK